MVEHRTTRDNPGAFVAADIDKTIVASLKRSLRYATQGKVKAACFEGAAALANWRDAKLRRKARFRCSCCGYVGAYLIHLRSTHKITWNSVCPRCASRSRHRGLRVFLPTLLDERPWTRKVLHFAPEPVLGAYFESRPDLDYKTTDLVLEDVDYPGEDICHLSFEQGSFDLILCNHVLEHVRRDDLAVSELSRILAPRGMALITIPGDWSRPESIVYPHLSNGDHYRDYGLDVLDLFRRYFSQVEMIDLHRFDRAPDGLSHGIRPGDCVFVCSHDRGR